MEIAGLAPSHRDDAVALWHAVGLTRPWNDPVADLDRALGGPSSTVLAAVEAGLVGTVMVGHDGHRGWLYYLAVDPRRRGEGIGRALVGAAEAWAAGFVPKVQLMVRADNTAAVAFYERLGYEPSQVTVLGRRLG
jgi:ribosomal protein S18 acetylase RimI-like enzyme